MGWLEPQTSDFWDWLEPQTSDFGTGSSHKQATFGTGSSHKQPTFGDKGYTEKLFRQLHEKGLHLITRLKKNMKNKLMLWSDKMKLRKRGIIESVNDQLKNLCQIEQTRHRSVANFMVNLVAESQIVESVRSYLYLQPLYSLE
ncbi:transposase [Argonema antarcticum]|uniref:transposase n=1 Tax=Argonema antarcticum TaxID=2942763 RepID=UPI003B8481C4